MNIEKIKELISRNHLIPIQAKVVLVINYVSPIQSPSLLIAFINKLNVPQKTGRQAIIRVFYTIVYIVKEFEVKLKLLTIYYHKEQLQTQLKQHNNIPKHHFQKVLSTLNLANTCLILPFQRLALNFFSPNNSSSQKKFETYIHLLWLTNTTYFIHS